MSRPHAEVPDMRTLEIQVPEPGFVIETDWKGYLRILRAVGDRHLRVTFDRGRLEIMSPSEEHEQIKTFMAIFLETVLAESNIDFRPGGSMTFKRRDLRRGLEPDECYWVTHWRAVLGRGHYDPRRDPPPDLALEVEVTRSMLDRIGIYEVLGVPEIWRWTSDDRLVFLCRAPSGAYDERARSPILRHLAPEAIMQQIRRGLDMSSTQWIRSLRQWVVQENATGEAAPTE